MSELTDLEMTKLCAEAMGYEFNLGRTEARGNFKTTRHWRGGVRRLWFSYDPLHDDAQAMALVREFWMVIKPPLRDRRAVNKLWYVNIPAEADYSVQKPDLNRAIVECVSKMQLAKESQ